MTITAVRLLLMERHTPVNLAPKVGHLNGIKTILPERKLLVKSTTKKTKVLTLGEPYSVENISYRQPLLGLT